MSKLYGLESYAPSEIAHQVEEIGVTKARLPALTTLVLATLAGGFIAIGAMFFTMATSDRAMGLVSARLLGGVVFSTGLLLVVTAGGELFTGNNLLVMAWASRRMRTVEVRQNWVLVFTWDTRSDATSRSWRDGNPRTTRERTIGSC